MSRNAAPSADVRDACGFRKGWAIASSRSELALAAGILLALLICRPVPARTTDAVQPAQVTPPATAAGPAQNASDIRDEYQRAVYFGKKFFEIGDYASALEQFEKADQILPDQPALLYDSALALTRLGRIADAQVRIERYLTIFPQGAEADNVKKLQLELDWQRELQKKQQIDHDYLELFNRGRFLLAHGDVEQALEVFQRAEQQHPDDPAISYNQAIAYEREGDFLKATERYRRYLATDPSATDKSEVDQRIFALERELDDSRTKMVCPFCGYKLPIGAMWCPHCWHGPFLTASSLFNTRACGTGASATRTSFYSDGRVARNEELACQLQGGNFLDAIKYTPPRRRAIQQQRIADGWTYDGDVLASRGSGTTEVELRQGEYLESVLDHGSGEILDFVAHPGSGGTWLLDRENLVIEGQRYTNRYSYDEKGRILQLRSSYVNTAACGDAIEMTADLTWNGDSLASVALHGGYTGYPAAGSPKTEWSATVGFAYDAQGRVGSEELEVDSYTKTWMQKPSRESRGEISTMYPGVRYRRPTDILRRGDYCRVVGSQLVGNAIDLRPFFAVIPDLATVLQHGVQRVTVGFTYPEGFTFR
ncbi:MAG: tetratricopeptide repeat protein [Thermoanaerobaculia bacterium]